MKRAGERATKAVRTLFAPTDPLGSPQSRRPTALGITGLDETSVLQPHGWVTFRPFRVGHFSPVDDTTSLERLAP